MGYMATLTVALAFACGLFSVAEGIPCGQPGRLACFSTGVAVCSNGMVPDEQYKCVDAGHNCGIDGHPSCKGKDGKRFCYTGSSLIGKDCVTDVEEPADAMGTRIRKLLGLGSLLGGGGGDVLGSPSAGQGGQTGGAGLVDDLLGNQGGSGNGGAGVVDDLLGNQGGADKSGGAGDVVEELLGGQLQDDGSRTDKLLEINVLERTDGTGDGLLEVEVLGQGTGGKSGDGLVTVQVLGSDTGKSGSLIDADILTSSGKKGGKSGGDGLVTVQVLGSDTGKSGSLIDADILTSSKGGGKTGGKSPCGALKQEPCHSTCQNIVRIPGTDVEVGINLTKYFHVVSEVACLQKCEDEEHCKSAVYNNVHHECYTKSAGAEKRVPAAADKHDRLVVLFCEHTHAGTCPFLSVWAGFDLQAISNVAAIDVLSRGECADECKREGSNCKGSVFNVLNRRCYTKNTDPSKMVAVLDVALALRLEVLSCNGTENLYCHDWHMPMLMDGKHVCMRGD